MSAYTDAELADAHRRAAEWAASADGYRRMFDEATNRANHLARIVQRIEALADSDLLVSPSELRTALGELP